MTTVIRRVAPAVAVAGLATGLVVRFDAALGGDDPDPPGPEVSTGLAAAPAAPPGADAPVPDEPATTGDDGPAGSEEPTGSEAPSRSEAPAEASDGCVGITVEGPLVSTEWGPLQVVAEVDDGVVCASGAVVYPDGDRRSVQINETVLPVIDAAVAESGDASFDVVTGATVTSEGYRASLQAILDQA